MPVFNVKNYVLIKTDDIQYFLFGATINFLIAFMNGAFSNEQKNYICSRNSL